LPLYAFLELDEFFLAVLDHLRDIAGLQFSAFVEQLLEISRYELHGFLALEKTAALVVAD